MRDTADDLSLEQQRIDHRPDIVDDRVADKFCGAGVGVDFDLADMATVWKGRRVGLEGGLRLKRRLDPRRQHHVIGLARHLADIQSPVGPGDAELAVLEHDILGRGLQHVGGEDLALLDNPVTRH